MMQVQARLAQRIYMMRLWANSGLQEADRLVRCNENGRLIQGDLSL